MSWDQSQSGRRKQVIRTNSFIIIQNFALMQNKSPTDYNLLEQTYFRFLLTLKYCYFLSKQYILMKMVSQAILFWLSLIPVMSYISEYRSELSTQ